MKQYFRYCETPRGYIIVPVHDLFTKGQIRGSFGLLACRVMGISWPNWLRYCRAQGAKLYGKGTKYVVAYWDTPNMTFLNMLNKRANELAQYVDFSTLDY